MTTAALALAFTAPPTTPSVSFRRTSLDRQHRRQWILPRAVAAMHSTKDDFDDDDEYRVDSSYAYDDVDKDDGGNGRRVRKRDLLRNRITKKLNTDYLFRGMPSIESMLGGGGGGLSSSSSTTASTGDDEEGHDRGEGGSGRTIPTTGSSDDGSKLQNQYMTGWWWQTTTG